MANNFLAAAGYSRAASDTCCHDPAAYYRGAMGILLVYDVTDEASFNNIRNWMRNIEQHASDTVNKVGPQRLACSCDLPSAVCEAIEAGKVSLEK